jgi:hypothetical protein
MTVEMEEGTQGRRDISLPEGVGGSIILERDRNPEILHCTGYRLWPGPFGRKPTLAVPWDKITRQHGRWIRRR